MSERGDIFINPPDMRSQETVRPLSPRGISAISGKTDASLVEEKDPLQTAMEKTNDSVKVHEGSNPGLAVEYYKLRGRLGEDLACDNMPDSANLNDLTEKKNFAGYDITSPYEMASCKVKQPNEDGSLRYADYRKYFRDIVNPNSRSNLRAAEDMLKIKESDPEKWAKLKDSLPAEVAAAGNVKEMSEAQTNYSSLRIPGDQLSRVRADLTQNVVSFPENYGLEPSTEPQELAEKAEQISRRHLRSLHPKYTFADIDIASQGLLNHRHE